jgi:phosphate/sulfate permease
MAEHDSGEIRRHAAVGGVIALFLAAFHVFEPWWLGFVEHQRVWWIVLLAIALLAAAFFVAFAAISMVEAFWRKLQENRRIAVPDIGVVDGQWIDAIVEKGEVRQGSIITISSAAKSGFTVSGRSYRVDTQKQLAPAPHGSFTGHHGSLWRTSTRSFRSLSPAGASTNLPAPGRRPP